MKKLILFALVSLAIISCRKDDESENKKSQFEGTWTLAKNQILNGKDNQVLFSNDNLECSYKRTCVFEGETISVTHFKENYVGLPCTINNVENGKFTYDETSKKITFKFDSQMGQYSEAHLINLITTTEMQLIDSNYQYDYNQDGITDKYVMVFNK